MRRLLPALFVPVLALAACQHDGRTLRPARPDQNVSISTTSSTVASTVVSSSFDMGSTTTSGG